MSDAALGSVRIGLHFAEAVAAARLLTADGGARAEIVAEVAALVPAPDDDRRRRMLGEGFRAAGLSCHEPMGAFYVFPAVEEAGLTSQTFCERLIYEKKVATVPGDAFGTLGEGHIRCSCAASNQNIIEASRRIGEFVEELRGERG